MIHVRSLTVRYGIITALKNLSFDVTAGECLIVTGASGCGKSTLARVLSGLIPQAISAHVEGEVRICGLDVFHQEPATVAQCVGTVFQNPNAHFFHLRVEDEVAFGPRNLGLSEEEVMQRVNWALDSVGLSNLREQAPFTLSGGQMQRLAIASALAMYPKVLVLDEPTASLDVPGTYSLISALQELRARLGMTIVLIEHRLAEVQKLADRVLVLDEGQIVADGPFSTVLTKPELIRRYGLRRPTDEPLQPWSELLSPNGHNPKEGKPLLELVHLNAGYNGHPAIKDINLKIFSGEFLALVGDNGAGKSTLALAASGLIKPYQGKVLFKGMRKPQPGRDISLLFQNPADQLIAESVEEEVAFGARNFRCYDAQLHEQILQHADLLPLRNRRPFSLSMGQQQRTALASCLALSPHLLILDEPTLGQDWQHLQTLMRFIKKLNAQGTAILLITHDYKLVHHYAKRIILMEHGRIVLDGLNTSRLHLESIDISHREPEAIQPHDF